MHVFVDITTYFLHVKLGRCSKSGSIDMVALMVTAVTRRNDREMDKAINLQTSCRKCCVHKRHE